MPPSATPFYLGNSNLIFQSAINACAKNIVLHGTSQLGVRCGAKPHLAQMHRLPIKRHKTTLCKQCLRFFYVKSDFMMKHPQIDQWLHAASAMEKMLFHVGNMIKNKKFPREFPVTMVILSKGHMIPRGCQNRIRLLILFF